MLDHASLRLINVARDRRIICDQHHVDLIKAECERIASGDDRLASNYSWDNLHVSEHESFDLLMHGDDIVTWCGLFNGGRYSEGVYRIMNRLYLNPRFRDSLYPAYARELIYPYQRQQHVDKIKLLFLSRQDIKGKYHLKRWIKYHCSETGWRLSKKMVQVSDCQQRSCYQYIAFKQFTPVDWLPETLTEAQWLELQE